MSLDNSEVPVLKNIQPGRYQPQYIPQDIKKLSAGMYLIASTAFSRVFEPIEWQSSSCPVHCYKDHSERSGEEREETQ